MPCPSWGISAHRCNAGSRLAEQDNTVCSGCYARKGRYLFGNVKERLEKRYEGLFHELWTPAMIHLINWHCERYFRLFDSGDLQGENHLLNINTIAKNTPDVLIWMPSREIETIRSVQRRLREGFAKNLIVRVSGNQVDGKPPKGFKHTSTVVTDPEKATCPSSLQFGKCEGCRACWEEGTVSYLKH